MFKRYFDARGVIPASSGQRFTDLLGGLSHAAQVVVVMRSRFMSFGEAPSQVVFNERCRPVIAAYRDLKAMGYDIPLVTEFRLLYALALLGRWREENLDRTTITSRWAVLRQWVMDIGRPGMLGSLEDYWPAGVD